jgi:hypothetical protein
MVPEKVSGESSGRRRFSITDESQCPPLRRLCLSDDAQSEGCISELRDASLPQINGQIQNAVVSA